MVTPFEMSLSKSPVCLAFALMSCLQFNLIRSLATKTNTMAGKHLTLGSSDPPLIPGSIRLYSMRFCPFSHRAHLVLLAKNVSFNPVFINLNAKPEWYKGKVPALLIDGESVYESLILADFLDEKFPPRPLHNKDPLRKAKDRILIEGFGKVISPFYKVMTGTNASAEQFESVLNELTAYEKELVSRKTKFFGGEKPGMLDYMIWPWFERIEMFKVLYGDEFVIPQERLPTLSSWISAMKSDDVVSQYYLTPDQHAKFMRTHQAGSPDYDILTKE